jgi:hypothetical protein
MIHDLQYTQYTNQVFVPHVLIALSARIYHLSLGYLHTPLAITHRLSQTTSLSVNVYTTCFLTQAHLVNPSPRYNPHKDVIK